MFRNSRLYHINYKFFNLLLKESIKILFSKEKLDTFIVSYSYHESNTQDRVFQVCDKYDNFFAIKSKKSRYIF